MRCLRFIDPTRCAQTKSANCTTVVVLFTDDNTEGSISHICLPQTFDASCCIKRLKLIKHQLFDLFFFLLDFFRLDCNCLWRILRNKLPTIFG